MKKYFLMFLFMLLCVNPAFSEEPVPAPAEQAVETATEEIAEMPAMAESEPMELAEAVSEAPAPLPVASEVTMAENLEFISGEISGVDAAAKSITLKLYGDTEESAAERILTLTVDEATDITDGEKDRDLQSLSAGTEVDVEYDPKTSKSTYIFVY